MAEFYAEGGVPGDLAVGTADAVPTQTERILAAVVQGAYFVGGIGFLLLPLAFWIVLRNRSVFVAHHAKQAFLSQCVVFVLRGVSPLSMPWSRHSRASAGLSPGSVGPGK